MSSFKAWLYRKASWLLYLWGEGRPFTWIRGAGFSDNLELVIGVNGVPVVIQLKRRSVLTVMSPHAPSAHLLVDLDDSTFEVKGFEFNGTLNMISQMMWRGKTVYHWSLPIGS